MSEAYTGVGSVELCVRKVLGSRALSQPFLCDLGEQCPSPAPLDLQWLTGEWP